MDFDLLINRYTYRDIDDSDSESEDNRPDLFEPPDQASPLPSPCFTPQRSPSPPPIQPLPPRAILPGDKPPPTLPSIPVQKKKSHHTIGARIQALTL